MADPYAARESSPVGEQPAGKRPDPLDAIVERLGGVAARDLGELAALAERASPRFVAVLVRDETLLPPLAAIDAPFAVALLLLPAATATAESTSAALAALEGSGADVFLLKQGIVAGPAGRDGAVAVEVATVERVLEAALDGAVEWESDPDFGYRVPAAVSGTEGAQADALCPRLTYAAADRVYEHAEAVTALKQARHRRVAAIDGIDERILAATG